MPPVSCCRNLRMMWVQSTHFEPIPFPLFPDYQQLAVIMSDNIVRLRFWYVSGWFNFDACPNVRAQIWIRQGSFSSRFLSATVTQIQADSPFPLSEDDNKAVQFFSVFANIISETNAEIVLTLHRKPTLAVDSTILPTQAAISSRTRTTKHQTPQNLRFSAKKSIAIVKTLWKLTDLAKPTPNNTHLP